MIKITEGFYCAKKELKSIKIILEMSDLKNGVYSIEVNVSGEIERIRSLSFGQNNPTKSMDEVYEIMKLDVNRIKKEYDEAID